MSETTLIFRSPISAPASDVLAWHGNPGAFERLTPPWMRVRVLDTHGGIAPGDWARVRVPVGPLGFAWTLVHDALTDVRGFVDIQEAGPFRAWRHEHRFLDEGPGQSVLEDRITYELPLGPAGRALAGPRVRTQLQRLFRFRHLRTQLDLARHLDAGIDRPLRIAVTGASGLVGSRLVPFLRAGGHEVVTLVRRQPRANSEVFWDPAAWEIDAAALEGLDAVVHLAGVSLATGRWTAARKQAILDSRVQGTGLLAQTLARLDVPPRVLVSASGIGYYGADTDGVLTEASPQGEGFLAEVCAAWEHAALPAANAGIRVVNARFAPVLASEGGLLGKLGPVYRLGAGGPIGNGQQVMPWIALDDLLGVILEAIANDALEGPVNATAPEPATNRAFAKALGRVLGRPALLPAPATALRLATGEVADEMLLASQRAQPARLEDVGFQFAFPTLEGALRHELGRYAAGDAAKALVPRRHAATNNEEDDRSLGMPGNAIRIPVRGNGASHHGSVPLTFSTRTERAPHGRAD